MVARGPEGEGGWGSRKERAGERRGERELGREKSWQAALAGRARSVTLSGSRCFSPFPMELTVVMKMF